MEKLTLGLPLDEKKLENKTTPPGGLAWVDENSQEWTEVDINNKWTT